MFNFWKAKSHVYSIGFMTLMLAVFFAFAFYWVALELILIGIGLTLFSIVPSFLVYRNHKKHMGHLSIKYENERFIVIDESAQQVQCDVYEYDIRHTTEVEAASVFWRVPVSDLRYWVVMLKDGRKFYCSSFHGVNPTEVRLCTTRKAHLLPIIDEKWNSQF